MSSSTNSVGVAVGFERTPVLVAVLVAEPPHLGADLVEVVGGRVHRASFPDTAPSYHLERVRADPAESVPGGGRFSVCNVGYPAGMNWIAALIAAAVTMGVLDGLWLGVIARDVYRSELGPLMRASTNVPAAAIFYGMYVVGVTTLVVRQFDGVGTAALVGAGIGAMAYGTYDLTNMATVEGFTWKITAIDITWGCALTAAVSAAGEWASGW